MERTLRPRPLARRHAGRGPRSRLVRDPAPHPRRGAARGLTSRPASTTTSSGTTGKRPWPSTASPIVDGLPAMTAGCAPTTPSNTWSRRRSHRRADHKGTGQDLARGGDIPVWFLGTKPVGASVVRMTEGLPSGCDTPSWGRSAGSAIETWPGPWSGHFGSRTPACVQRGLHAPARGEFRTGVGDRTRERGGIRRPRAGPARRSRPQCPLLTTALPDGLTVTGAVALADRAPALQEAVTVCRLAGRRRTDPRRGGARRRGLQQPAQDDAVAKR